MSLTKLRKKLEKLEKERVNLNQNKLYQDRKAVETNNPKKFSKFDTMARFYGQQLQKVDKEISELTLAISTEENKGKEEAHKKLIKDFCLEARELILTFKETLEAEEWEEAIRQADNLKDYFEERGRSIEQFIYPILHYVKFTSIKITLSKILVEKSEIQRIEVTFGKKITAQKVVNVQRLKEILVGQMRSLIETIDSVIANPKRGEKIKSQVQRMNRGAVTSTTYKTDRQALVEKRIKEQQDKGVIIVNGKKEPNPDSALGRAYKRFLDGKKEGD